MVIFIPPGGNSTRQLIIGKIKEKGYEMAHHMMERWNINETLNILSFIHKAK